MLRFQFHCLRKYKTYKNLQIQIKECDLEIEKLLQEQIDNNHNKKQHYTIPKVRKRVIINTPKNIDLNLVGYQYFEVVDLLK